MNTLQSHHAEFDGGIVTELGFSALDDAEGYGAASSIGACSSCLARIWDCVKRTGRVELYSPGQPEPAVATEVQLKEWCTKHFPASYAEYLRRIGINMSLQPMR